MVSLPDGILVAIHAEFSLRTLLLGRYYVFFRHQDMFPSGVGNQLVQAIPVSEEDYKVWLANLRKAFADTEQELDATYFNIDESKLTDLQKGGKWVAPERLVTVNDHIVELRSLPPTPFRPQHDLWIEYIYVIDLEAEEFLVSGSGINCAFELGKIDPAFFAHRRVELDENYMPIPPDPDDDFEEGEELLLKRALVPDTEADVLARLGLPSAPAEAEKKFTFVAEEPRSKYQLPRGMHSATVLARTIYSIWLTRLKTRSLTDRHVSVHDKAFREACYAILCLVLGNSLRLTTSSVESVKDGIFDCKSSDGEID